MSTLGAHIAVRVSFDEAENILTSAGFDVYRLEFSNMNMMLLCYCDISSGARSSINNRFSCRDGQRSAGDYTVVNEILA